MPRQLWVLGYYRSGTIPNVIWELCGVYLVRGLAVEEAQKNGNPSLFVARIMANTFFAPPVEPFPEIEWPNKAEVASNGG